MSQKSWLLGAALAASLAASGWLFIENRSLRQQLGAAHAGTGATEAAPRSHTIPAPADAEAPGASRARAPLAWMQGMSRPAPAERAELAEDPGDAPPEESRAERRQRRQDQITALLGRHEGESADEYRARMAPLVVMSLAGPRGRLEDARRAVEEAAGVTGEQRAALDAVVTDVFAEAIDLTNRAVEAGELTPYERNWSGVLNLAGGMGAILQGAEGRIGQILSPEQARAVLEHGFEWGEYLAVMVPWETLDAPPLPR